MAVKTMKCTRCKGKGDVRKYIMYGCSEYLLEIWDILVNSTLYFPLYLLASFIIGGILGFFYSILLRNILPFYIFGVTFYFFGGISLLFILCITLIDYKILFKNIIITPIVVILLIFFGYMNVKIGRYIIFNKGGFNMIINLIYSFIQGGSVGFSFVYLLLKTNFIDEINGRTKCPLCEGSKNISITKFNEMRRCQSCDMNCGYKNPIGISLFQKRHFCDNCKGVGYIK